MKAKRGLGVHQSFNLVIENLLISTSYSPAIMLRISSCFNLVIENLLISTQITIVVVAPPLCFNLVIENLLISTKGEFGVATFRDYRFNLVIENLLISTRQEMSLSG